jgi:hypothetical protein
MGAARISFLMKVVAVVCYLSSQAHGAINMDLEKSFRTGDEINVWAQGFFFGGCHTTPFSREGKDLVVVIGQPTSGLSTSQVILFGRQRATDEYSLILASGVIAGSIVVKEDANGVVLLARDKPILVVPFDLATANMSFNRPAGGTRGKPNQGGK